MKLNIHTLVEQVVKEEMAKLGEAKPFKVNPKYNVFALDKATNKIVNGWELDPKDRENVQDYIKKTNVFLKQDLKDMEIKPSDVSIASVRALKAKNIDPFNWDNWKKLGEATTTIVTPDGKTLTPAQQMQVKTAKPGSTIVTKKAGELTEDTSIEEKKEEPKEELPPVEDAPTSASVSEELNNHISSAIDAAAKCIQDTGDKKYEKVLGKVIKNLTAAQDALIDVQSHENKLAEVAAAEDEKSTASYTKSLAQILKKEFKNPSHVDAILKKYAKVIKQSKTSKDPSKLAEVIGKHALREGLIQKGDLLK